MICETIAMQSRNPHSFIKTYILDGTQAEHSKKRPFVLVIPGGGYEHFGQREQESVAVKMNSFGFHAAVLYYTLAPMHFPDALCDAAEAVALVRARADDWHVDSEKIILCGFSAGGHLAATLGCYWNSDFIQRFVQHNSEQIRPNYLVLCYPVITADSQFQHEASIQNVLGKTTDFSRDDVSIEKHISNDFPPSFIWHTNRDEAVPAENTLLLVQALRRAGVAFEYHLFSRGRHGLSLATAETADAAGNYIEPECAVWPELFINWFNEI